MDGLFSRACSEATGDSNRSASCPLDVNGDPYPLLGRLVDPGHPESLSSACLEVAHLDMPPRGHMPYADPPPPPPAHSFVPLYCFAISIARVWAGPSFLGYRRRGVLLRFAAGVRGELRRPKQARAPGGNRPLQLHGRVDAPHPVGPGSVASFVAGSHCVYSPNKRPVAGPKRWWLLSRSTLS